MLSAVTDWTSIIRQGWRLERMVAMWKIGTTCFTEKKFWGVLNLPMWLIFIGEWKFDEYETSVKSSSTTWFLRIFNSSPDSLEFHMVGKKILEVIFFPKFCILFFIHYHSFHKFLCHKVNIGIAVKSLSMKILVIQLYQLFWGPALVGK